MYILFEDLKITTVGCCRHLKFPNMLLVHGLQSAYFLFLAALFFELTGESNGTQHRADVPTIFPLNIWQLCLCPNISTIT